MEQVVIPRIGPPSVMEVRSAPDPEPGPGQVRIQVEAAGINFADLMARIGVYPDAPPLPAVVGYEVGGTIDAVGEGVDPARVGQPVLAATAFGGYSSHVVVKSKQALLRPEGLGAQEGASLVVTGLTAWMMCEAMGRVREGDRVLIHSAGGGVGLAALDLVKWRGGVAVGTASAGKHAFLKARGYDELVDYTQVDFHEALKDGPPFDLVLDPVGGESWRKSFELLGSAGRLVCFGFSANAAGNKRSLLATLKNLGQTPWLLFNPVRVINANKGVMGVNMGRLWGEEDKMVAWLEALLELWAQGVLRPHVDTAFPFSRAAEAHQYIHDRKNVGKVLLVPDALHAG
ncbi:MAG: zinc-binding dehydrogenase [Myxococcales bacterium]|nr:zinc-binding dehydrogenase [Myxococcales bacterium]